jgi:phosphoribosylglycinamide formyltransferase-1
MPSFEPVRVAIVTSRGVPGIDAILADARRGSLYDVVCVVATDPDLADAEAVDAAGVPLLLHPFRRFHEERGLASRNLRARETFDGELVEILAPLAPQYILLVGYRQIVTEPLLTAYPDRIISIHESDMTLLDGEGRRRYIGLHAVRDAIFAGERETRCSIHLVTGEVGGGALMLLSTPYPVPPMVADLHAWNAHELLDTYARVHRQWMLRNVAGPLLVRLLELLAAGTITIVRDTVWIDGVPGPCRLGDAPPLCYSLESQIRRGIPASCPLISESRAVINE